MPACKRLEQVLCQCCGRPWPLSRALKELYLANADSRDGTGNGLREYVFSQKASASYPIFGREPAPAGNSLELIQSESDVNRGVHLNGLSIEKRWPIPPLLDGCH